MAVAPDFVPFQKIPRLRRDCIITEKIDGTNASVHITQDGEVFAGSRTRWITPESDNYGFALWVRNREDELRRLGPGTHFGEWWGLGIQRGYGLSAKHFSLFNTSRWPDGDGPPPAGVGVVPVLYMGPLSTDVIDRELDALRSSGSRAAPGFKPAEGVVIYLPAARALFKCTLDSDGVPKSRGNRLNDERRSSVGSLLAGSYQRPEYDAA